MSMNGAILRYINQLECLTSETKPEENQLNPQAGPFVVSSDCIIYLLSNSSIFSHNLFCQPHLPPGWEAMVTTDGCVYYKDYNARSITWTIPLPPPKGSVQRSASTASDQAIVSLSDGRVAHGIG